MAAVSFIHRYRDEILSLRSGTELSFLLFYRGIFQPDLWQKAPLSWRERGAMSRQADLFDRATKCQLASQEAANEAQRFVFLHLRDLWTSLANESPGMTDALLAKEIAAIEEVHDAAFGLEENHVPE